MLEGNVFFYHLIDVIIDAGFGSRLAVVGRRCWSRHRRKMWPD